VRGQSAMCLLCRLVPSFLLRLLMTDKLQAFFILSRCGCDRHWIWEMTIWVAHLCLFWIATSPWNLIKMHTWFQMCIRVRSSWCSYGLHCGLSNWRICGSEHCVVDSREKNNTIGLPRKMVVMQFLQYDHNTGHWVQSNDNYNPFLHKVDPWKLLVDIVP
jgi:hypothetical protein